MQHCFICRLKASTMSDDARTEPRNVATLALAVHLLNTNIKVLVGFGREFAPVRCAHPSFWAYQHAKRGTARPPAHRSFAAPPKIKK